MKYPRTVSVVLLLFLSASALWGSAVLTVEAHGNPWGFLPQSLLQDSPFHSWLIPGMILLLGNGLLPLWVLLLGIVRSRYFGHWVVLQGCELFGFLAAEYSLLRSLLWPHYLYGTVALVLILSGITLYRRDPRTHSFA